MSRCIVVMKLPASHQMPTAAAFCIIQIVSTEEYSSDADLLLYSVILNTTATQYTCSLNSAYHPH